MDCNKLKVTPIKSYTGTPPCEIYSTIAEKKTENLSLVRYCKKIVLLWGKCYTKGGILTNDKEKRIITIILL